MKIYKITARSDERGRCIDWASNKSEAARKSSKHAGNGYVHEREITPIHFKPTKFDVLRLMLTNCPFHDNS